MAVKLEANESNVNNLLYTLLLYVVSEDPDQFDEYLSEDPDSYFEGDERYEPRLAEDKREEWFTANEDELDRMSNTIHGVAQNLAKEFLQKQQK